MGFGLYLYHTAMNNDLFIDQEHVYDFACQEIRNMMIL